MIGQNATSAFKTSCTAKVVGVLSSPVCNCAEFGPCIKPYGEVGVHFGGGVLGYGVWLGPSWPLEHASHRYFPWVTHFRAEFGAYIGQTVRVYLRRSRKILAHRVPLFKAT